MKTDISPTFSVYLKLVPSYFQPSQNNVILLQPSCRLQMLREHLFLYPAHPISLQCYSWTGNPVMLPQRSL